MCSGLRWNGENHPHPQRRRKPDIYLIEAILAGILILQSLSGIVEK